MKNRMQMIKKKIDSLPGGSHSASNKYWCVTCKKFFVLDKPECPYMTGMCVNTPIAVENLAPESTASLEKFGLFYPKTPQKIISKLVKGDYEHTGKKMANIYLDFLKEWYFDLSREQPLQTIKSFIIIMSGCETAQRVNENEITFVLMDAGKIWQKERIKGILTGALVYLREKLDVAHQLKIDFIDILGEREIGKYYCAKCGMFFEFGMAREKVTCPLMSQKCMFDPQHISKIKYDPEALRKQYEITPPIYKRFIQNLGVTVDYQELEGILDEWGITTGKDEVLRTIVE